MGDFIKKLMGFSVGPLLASILSIILIPVTTYFISPDEYGKASLFTTIQSILVAISYLGLDQSFVVYYHEQKNKVKLFSNSIILPIIVTIIAFITLPLYTHLLSNVMFSSSEYTLAVIGLIVMIPFIIVSRFVLLALRMENKALEYSFCSITVNLATFIITLIFVLLIRRDFLAIVYSAILGQIMASLYLILKYRKLVKFNIHDFDKELFINLVKYGLPFIVSILVGWALNSMDQMFLRYFNAFEELGFYTLAMRLANMLLIIQTSFTSFWTPTYFLWDKEDKPKFMFDLVSQGLSLIISLLFLLILTFKNLIPIIVSEKYESSIYILPFLLFYPLFFTMSETTSCGIFLKKKSNLTIIIAIGSLLTNLALNILLVPKYGGKGAAIATGFSYLIFFWLRTLISRRIWYKFPIWRFVVLSFLLFGASFINTFFADLTLVTVVNIISIICILFIHSDVIIYFFKNIKQR